MNDMPSLEAEVEELAQDARAERRLVWQAVAAGIVVVVIVIVRELLLR